MRGALDGLGWAWRGSSCRITWFGSVGGVIFCLGEFEEFEEFEEDRVRGGIDGEGGVGSRVD